MTEVEAMAAAADMMEVKVVDMVGVVAATEIDREAPEDSTNLHLNGFLLYPRLFFSKLLVKKG